MPKKASSQKKLSRQEKRDLDIEIGFLEGVVRRDPQFVEALEILGDDYTRRGRFEDGLQVDELLVKLKPEDPLAHYNLACSFSLVDEASMAVQSLDQAINLGFRDFRWMAQDPDLSKVRRHPLFRRIRSKIRSLQVKVR